MKKITVTMIALCIALVSGATLAKSSRVDVLHKPDTAAERVITISVSALPAHCRHGDLAADRTELAQCVGDDEQSGDGGEQSGDGNELIQICHIDTDNAQPEDIFQSELRDYEADHQGHDVVVGDCPF